MVEVAVFPLLMLRLVGLAFRVKSGFTTCTFIVVVCVNLPSVPVMVTG